MGQRPSTRDEDTSARLLRLAGASILAITALAVYLRLYFGIDFTDESYYAALPYAFSLGHRPFQDELAVHQLAGLMLEPAVLARIAWIGSADGIVLFMRQLYFVVALVCAALVVSRFGRVVGRTRAMAFAAILLAWIPFGTPALSYNTIAFFGLLAGLLLVAFAPSSRRPPLDLFWGTFALATVSIAYPTLALAAAAACAAGIWQLRRGRQDVGLVRIAMPALHASLLWAAIVVFVALRYDAIIHVSRVAEMNELIGTQGGGIAKLAALWHELAKEAPFLLALGLVLGLVAASFARIRSSRLRALAVGLAAPGLIAASWLYVPHTEPFTTTTFLISALGLASGFAIRPGGPAHRGVHGVPLTIVSVASLAAAVTILWSTANGLRNAALGLAPAALVGLGLLTRALPGRSEDCADGASERSGECSLQAAALIFVASTLIFQGLQLRSGIYRDHPISMLAARVEQGPYAGLYTTPARSRFVAELADVLARLRPGCETILFFDYFPAGYLFSDLRPTTAALWMFPSDPLWQGNPAIRHAYAAPFDRPDALPDLAVVMNAIPMWDGARPLEPPAQDPVLSRLRDAHYETVHRSSLYRVLKKPGKME